ncbi:MAG: hypothetical protein A2X86_08535 [Bdellovibrionales bacterium GWA2_49_15]|nr:MAG: hypothetical protein A2X86_08535 [Bdellovibrionales bacterium GWA2_49_15]HAZ11191.1 hypothetical protein [Bdellovibrionales bacterium]
MKNVVFGICCFTLSGCLAPKQIFPEGNPFHEKANPVLSSELSSEGLEAQTAAHLVKVAIIDSGVDYRHPQLRQHLRLNKSHTGFGLDILGEDGLPYPIILNPETGEEIEDIFGVNEHGTHVSSLALLGAKLEIPEAHGEKVDIGPRLGLIPIRVLPLDDEGMDTVASGERSLSDKLMSEKLVAVLSRSITYAIQEGAHIANLSLGVDPAEQSLENRAYLKQLVETDFYKKISVDGEKILFVFAAGNESVVVSDGYFPASLKAANTLTVGALDNNSTIADYSNFGDLVDVYIRGTDVQGLLPGGLRGKMSGTSMAAPLVANLAAKMKLLAPCLSASQMRALIIEQAAPLTKNVRVARFKETLDAVRALPAEFKLLKCRN